MPLSCRRVSCGPHPPAPSPAGRGGARTPISIVTGAPAAHDNHYENALRFPAQNAHTLLWASDLLFPCAPHPLIPAPSPFCILYFLFSIFHFPALARRSLHPHAPRPRPGALAVAFLSGTPGPGPPLSGRSQGRRHVVRRGCRRRALRRAELDNLYPPGRPSRRPRHRVLCNARLKRLCGYPSRHQPLRRKDLAPRLPTRRRPALAHLRPDGGDERQPVGRQRMGRAASKRPGENALYYGRNCPRNGPPDPGSARDRCAGQRHIDLPLGGKLRHRGPHGRVAAQPAGDMGAGARRPGRSGRPTDRGCHPFHRRTIRYLPDVSVRHTGHTGYAQRAARGTPAAVCRHAIQDEPVGHVPCLRRLRHL